MPSRRQKGEWQRTVCAGRSALSGTRHNATEFDGEDTFFGLVDGHERELGYFSLRELESVRGALGLPIERDLYWRPKTLREIAPDLFSHEDPPTAP
jgi:hypothetical protein